MYFFQVSKACFQRSSKFGASTTNLSTFTNKHTFPYYFVIDILPLHAHGLQQLLRILQLDFLPPGDDVDQSQDGVVQVVYLKVVDDERGLQVLGVVDEVDDIGEEGEVDGERRREEEQSSRCDHCGQLQHNSLTNKQYYPNTRKLS